MGVLRVFLLLISILLCVPSGVLYSDPADTVETEKSLIKSIDPGLVSLNSKGIGGTTLLHWAVESGYPLLWCCDGGWYR